MNAFERKILGLSNRFERELLMCASATNSHEPLEASSILTEPPISAVETVLVAWAIALGKLLAVHNLDVRVAALVETKKQVARAQLMDKLVALSPREQDTFARRVKMFEARMSHAMTRLNVHEEAPREVRAEPRNLLQVACAAAVALALVMHRHDTDGTMSASINNIVRQAHDGVIAGRNEAEKA